jgi:hypothetical protein
MASLLERSVPCSIMWAPNITATTKMYSRDDDDRLGSPPFLIQQRDVTPRLMITRFRSGVSSMAISPRPSASLMAARALALPMLARSAICATGSEHFPLACCCSIRRARWRVNHISGWQCDCVLDAPLTETSTTTWPPPPIHSTERTSHSRNSPRATRNAM